jgi:hypothetical protein
VVSAGSTEGAFGGVDVAHTSEMGPSWQRCGRLGSVRLTSIRRGKTLGHHARSGKLFE